MSRDEAMTAVLNAARAVRGSDPSLRRVEQPEVRRLLLALYYTIDAVDSAGDADSDYPDPCPTCADLRAQLAELRGDRPGMCQGAEDCWRQPDLPGGLCHHHSQIAQKPHPWQRAALRSGIFAVEPGDG